MTVRRFALVLTAFVLALTGLTTTPAGAQTGGLPRLNITQRYVTGISSGGYMATQLQVAWSSRFRGAAVFSAGPYWCAMDSVVVALQSCTEDNAPRDMANFYAVTDQYESDHKIDPTVNLTRSRTYFFHGTQDPTV